MSRATFGTTSDGQRVDCITLRNAAISAAILTHGATLQDLRLAGIDRSLTLGSPHLEDYAPGGALEYAGAIVGPVANRISNATASLDGQRLALDVNAAGGHHMHGGRDGVHRQVWSVAEADKTHVRLALDLPDGATGLPGTRRIEALYALGTGPELTLRLSARTDAPTWINLSNHGYWNLSPNPTFHGHRLEIEAETYLPADENAMVTGAVSTVTGSMMDFRSAQTLTAAHVLDNTFCLSNHRTALRHVATLTAPDGLALALDTTEPGLQVYDARHLSSPGVPGHDGRRYGPRAGLALETQCWPDAPNQPQFPPIRLAPGEPWEQVTRFRFLRA